MKSEKPEAFQKLQVVGGDMTELALGISDEDMSLLTNQVNIVFHAAATVRFDENLKTAININLLGTEKLVDFCHKLNKLEVRNF